MWSSGFYRCLSTCEAELLSLVSHNALHKRQLRWDWWALSEYVAGKTNKKANAKSELEQTKREKPKQKRFAYVVGLESIR